MVPELYRDGVLVAGDAAGFCVNLGFTVRGMDFAIESGRLAAEAVIKAHEAGDFSAATLSSYATALNYSFIMRDLKSFKGFPTVLSLRGIFKDLPELCDAIAGKVFTVDGEPSMNIIMYIVDLIARRTSASELVDVVTKVLEAF